MGMQLYLRAALSSLPYQQRTFYMHSQLPDRHIKCMFILVSKPTLTCWAIHASNKGSRSGG